MHPNGGVPTIVATLFIAANFLSCGEMNQKPIEVTFFWLLRLQYGNKEPKSHKARPNKTSVYGSMLQIL